MTPAASADAPRLTVRPATQAVTLSGYTRARAALPVAAEMGGRVLAVHYDVGQAIGDKPFARIDPTFVDFQIEQVKRQLERLDVALERHVSRIGFLEKEFERIDALYRDEVAPLSRWEAAGEELAQARLELRGVAAERNALAVQQRELAERRRRHDVPAPEGWVVVARRVEPGEMVAAGAPLARVADFRTLVVPLFVTEQELAAMGERDPLPVTVAGRPGRARINWINPDFDEQTRKSAVELVLVGHDGEARGGLPVRLELTLPTRGLRVPRAAVTDRYDNPYVRLAPDGRMVPVFVTGEDGTDLIVADEGLLEIGTSLKLRPEDR
ncbi:efflux RND transporter periplasmic adaptor subunit [Desulfatitalea alkaliphila]|uniref:HlyD family efflux transporter periplasmic adaptor subunit n=1 Tax=Desulfatitalea alkaliphila TaxID=2929485 RepID=A0AA41QZQ4_9BACT|nr:HlyD family efflux transporter periplasmic adaptor subunit [Desulfatitalea alkaliphila]MCJ8499368.1 HlyD family efflux transporter periplasmic adaptor subunit [Desulfatitalea alkaliphila]